jgi:hypothetical protein
VGLGRRHGDASAGDGGGIDGDGRDTAERVDWTLIVTTRP